jgi:hypothetical protein
MTRRNGLPALLAVVLAIAMTWPLTLHLGSEAQRVDDWGDPLYLTWQVAWIGHALLHAPAHLLQSNFYWPIRNNLTFTDVLFGYAPAGLIATQGPHAALVVHNLLFIFTFVLAFLGAFLLARELGAGTWGGAAAGAVFAYAPWKLAQAGHLHVLSSGGIPLALYLMVRGYRRASGRWIVAGWLVAAWQMTLGFNLGLQFVYLLLALGAVVVGLWLVNGRRRPSGTVLRASALGIAVFVTVTGLVAAPYVHAQRVYPLAKMEAEEVAFFSPTPRAFISAPSYSLVWGDVTSRTRSTLPSSVEQSLFPGVMAVLLAVLGLWSTAYSRLLRLGLAVGTLACAALSLGLYRRGLTPFHFLYEYAPGWNGVRTPGRLNNLTSLGLALLAGAGVALAVRWAHRFSWSAAGVVIPAVLVAAILVEGFGPPPHERVPARPRAELAARAPQLHLPMIVGRDGIYAYWGIGPYPRMANAASSFEPGVVAVVRVAAMRFPDRSSVEFLRHIGVRSVVVHRDLARDTPWQGVWNRPVAGLGLTRRDDGELVIYGLGR